MICNMIRDSKIIRLLAAAWKSLAPDKEPHNTDFMRCLISQLLLHMMIIYTSRQRVVFTHNANILRDIVTLTH